MDMRSSGRVPVKLYATSYPPILIGCQDRLALLIMMDPLTNVDEIMSSIVKSRADSQRTSLLPYPSENNVLWQIMYVELLRWFSQYYQGETPSFPDFDAMSRQVSSDRVERSAFEIKMEELQPGYEEFLVQAQQNDSPRSDSLAKQTPKASMVIESAASSSGPSPAITGFFSATSSQVTTAFVLQPSLHIGDDIVYNVASHQTKDVNAYLSIEHDVDVRGKENFTFHLRNTESLPEQQQENLESAMRAAFAHQYGYTESAGHIIKLTLQNADVAKILEERLTAILASSPDVVDSSGELPADVAPTSSARKQEAHKISELLSNQGIHPGKPESHTDIHLRTKQRLEPQCTAVCHIL